MTIGQKIKFARSLRGITQKELGFMIGLSDVRIRQYEIDARTPKDGVLKDIASALGVSVLFFTDHAIETYNDILHSFFELENTVAANIIQISDSPPKYAISFENDALNELLGIWFKHKGSYVTDNNHNNIEYQLWKARYPESYAEECKEKIQALAKHKKEN